MGVAVHGHLPAVLRDPDPFGLAAQLRRLDGIFTEHGHGCGHLPDLILAAHGGDFDIQIPLREAAHGGGHLADRARGSGLDSQQDISDPQPEQDQGHGQGGHDIIPKPADAPFKQPIEFGHTQVPQPADLDHRAGDPLFGVRARGPLQGHQGSACGLHHLSQRFGQRLARPAVGVGGKGGPQRGLDTGQQRARPRAPDDQLGGRRRIAGRPPRERREPGEFLRQ